MEAIIDLLLKINPIHFSYLNPLVKWKILSVTELYKQSGYIGRKNSFHKIINRFEEENIVKSVKDLWSRNKYLYLTRIGDEMVNHSTHQLRVSEETLMHDLRLSEIVLYLVKTHKIEVFTLEHEFYSKGYYGANKLTPDARMCCNIFGHAKQEIGVELELTQKSKERIKEKMQVYVNSTIVDFCIYIFTLEQIAKTYHRLAMESFSKKENQKFIFLTSSAIARGKIDLRSSRGFHQDKTITYPEIFEAEVKETWWRR